MRRHLTLREVQSALHRGRQVEQFLGFGQPVDGRNTLSYVWISGRSMSGRLERCFDDGSPDFLDVVEFQELEDDADWDPFSGSPPDDGLRHFESVEAALAWARSDCGTTDDRWVNQGLIDAEYGEAKGW